MIVAAGWLQVLTFCCEFKMMINASSITNYILSVLPVCLLPLPLASPPFAYEDFEDVSRFPRAGLWVSNTLYIYIIKIYIKLKCLQTLIHANVSAENIESHFHADVHLAVSKVSTSSSTSNGDYCDYSLSQTVSMATDGN